jgi:uncharacterized delta-60 repeat protein
MFRHDRSFGVRGQVTTGFAGQDSWINAAVFRTDGKIVVTGRAGERGSLTTARYLHNGRRDLTFDFGGVVSTPSVDNGQVVTVQKDHKIIVVSASVGGQIQFALVRYRRNGSLDRSFGFRGIAKTTFGGDLDHPMAVAIQDDGKIVVVGQLGTTPPVALCCRPIRGEWPLGYDVRRWRHSNY